MRKNVYIETRIRPPSEGPWTYNGITITINNVTQLGKDTDPQTIWVVTGSAPQYAGDIFFTLKGA